MKNTKTKIILSAIIFLSVIVFSGAASAAGASLYVSPASLVKTAGNTFSASVGVNASGSKVCAVEGTLVFNNLICQSITVASDVMAQSSPTCSNSHFLIGIPNCTTSDKTLINISVKAGSAGTASISPTGVDIIGEGYSIGSASISGNYTINAVPTPTSTTTTTPTPSESVSTTTTTQETPTEENVNQEDVFNNNQANFLISAANLLTLGTDNPGIGSIVVAVILVIFLAIFFAVYLLGRRSCKREKLK